MTKRRRFSEKDVIRTLIHQGVKIADYRTGEPITLENVGRVQREHLHEISLGGPDDPANCRYSLDESHAIITNGRPATSAGSSKNRNAKANHSNRIEKFVVNKRSPQRALNADNIGLPTHRCRACGEIHDHCQCRPMVKRSSFGRKR